ncbi:MAG: hypothetical protein ACE5D4_10015 [Thermodesulfobacteriota bacterium]
MAETLYRQERFTNYIAPCSTATVAMGCTHYCTDTILLILIRYCTEFFMEGRAWRYIWLKSREWP